MIVFVLKVLKYLKPLLVYKDINEQNHTANFTANHYYICYIFCTFSAQLAVPGSALTSASLGSGVAAQSRQTLPAIQPHI